MTNTSIAKGEMTFAGAKRPFIAIKSDFMQGVINDFTKANRTWTNYPADTLEVILRHRGTIPKEFKYHGFDNQAEAAIFIGMPIITGEGLPAGFEMLPPDDEFLISKGHKPNEIEQKADQKILGKGEQD